MKICHSLIFFLTLQDGNIGLVSAKVYEGTEGETITVECPFSLFSVDIQKKMFCRNECENGDVLVETWSNSHKKGRYSISEGSSDNVMHVTITDLKESDSGQYQCVLERLGPDGHEEFEIKVTKKPKVDNKTTSKPSWTHRPSMSKRAPTSALTTTSASALTELSFNSSSTSEQMTMTSPGILLYVGLVLVVIFILFTAALVVLCRNKPNKPKEPQVNMEYTSAAEANTVYDEIKEDRENESNPVEISLLHASAKFTTEYAVPTSGVYNLATAAESQDKTADASETLIYSDVDFSNRTSSSVFPESQTAAVIYSAVSPPLYSTVDK